MRLLILFLYLLLFFLGIMFLTLNSGLIQINFYIMKFTMPVSLVMVVMFGLGLLFGVLLSIVRYFHFKIELSKLKTQLQMREKEIKNLRTIPLKN